MHQNAIMNKKLYNYLSQMFSLIIATKHANKEANNYKLTFI